MHCDRICTTMRGGWGSKGAEPIYFCHKKEFVNVEVREYPDYDSRCTNVFEPGEYRSDCKDGAFICVPYDSPLYFEYTYSDWYPDSDDVCIGFTGIKNYRSRKMWSDNFLCTDEKVTIPIKSGKFFTTSCIPSKQIFS